MRRRIKMKLINNYVEIYKILFACKYIIKNGESEDINIAINTSQEVLLIKENYETTFEKLKINDTSFLVLKKSLEDGLHTIPSPNYTPFDISKMHEIKAKISEELNKTSLKYKLNI